MFAVALIVMASCVVSSRVTQMVSAAPEPQLPNTDFYWQQINDHNRSLQRAKIPGGWLVAATNRDSTLNGVTFVPDVNHEWNGKTLLQKRTP